MDGPRHADSDAAEPYAPPRIDDAGVRRRRLNVLVLGLGVVTTVATCAMVEFFRSGGADPMGFYLNRVIPLGALLVGIVAGSGYGLGALWSQVRLRRLALALIVALQLTAWAATYVFAWWRAAPVYADGGSPVDLVSWFDAITQGMQWRSERGGTSDVLGAWGYLVRFGELVGFGAGGLLVPGAMAARPYCEECQRYLEAQGICSIPASGEARSFVRQKTQDAVDAPVVAQLQERITNVLTALERGDAAEVVAALAAARPPPPAPKAYRVVEVRRHRCQGCRAGDVELRLIDIRAGNQQRLALIHVDEAVMTAVSAFR